MPPLSDLAPRPFAEFEDLARALVELDVDLGEEPRHRVVGYRGEELLAVVDLRPFPPGGVQTPVVEAVAGLLPLGADRLAAALPGRAWSLHDPVAPVSDDGDLRQRVLMLTTARPQDARARSWLRPFDLVDGDLTWQAPVLDGQECEGWVPHALQVAAEAAWEVDPDGAVHQLARCTALGHTVLLGPAGADVADLATSPAGSA